MQLCCITAPLNSFYLGCDLNEPTVFSQFSAQDNQALRKSLRDARRRRDGDLQGELWMVGCVTRAGRRSNLGLRGHFSENNYVLMDKKNLTGKLLERKHCWKSRVKKIPLQVWQQTGTARAAHTGNRSHITVYLLKRSNTNFVCCLVSITRSQSRSLTRNLQTCNHAWGLDNFDFDVNLRQRVKVEQVQNLKRKRDSVLR